MGLPNVDQDFLNNFGQLDVMLRLVEVSNHLWSYIDPNLKGHFLEMVEEFFRDFQNLGVLE